MFKKYPLDFDLLEVGSVITVPEIEKHFSVKYGSDAYNFKTMSLKAAIETKTDFTAKITGGEIHVLTWQDASQYNDKSVDNAVSQMRRRIRKNTQVITDGFPPELKQQHERRLMKGAFLLEALKETRKKILKIGTNGNGVKQIGGESE